MQLSLSLLRKYLPLDMPLQLIEEALINLGIEVEKLEILEDKNVVFHLGLTPDKGYCKSVMGIVYDLAAYFNTKPITPTKVSICLEEGSLPISIINHASHECPFFSVAKIHNAKVAPSPPWLQKELELAGFTAVNNVVDTLNYTMLLFGQPMHAYDYNRLSQPSISIETLESPIAFEALDLKEYELPRGSCMIFSAHQPIAIAGVMGSMSSSVDSRTQNLLIEAAEFIPAAIRLSSKACHLRTESSHRFETLIDPHKIKEHLAFAIQMITELTGGHYEGYNSTGHSTAPIAPIALNPAQVCRLLGIELAWGEIIDLLERAFCKVRSDKERLLVTPPTWRRDLNLPVDLIEEIARLIGNKAFSLTHPRAAVGCNRPSPEMTFEKGLHQFLISQGYSEWLTPALIGREVASWQQSPPIQVAYAKSNDYSILRSSLLPGMLLSARHNLNRGIHTLRAFEIGSLHFTDRDEFKEHLSVALLLTGDQLPAFYDRSPLPVDFFDMKATFEKIAQWSLAPPFSFLPSHHPFLHPYRQASIMIDKIAIGYMGQLHPSSLKQFGIDQELYFGQIDLTPLISSKFKEKIYLPLSNQPSIERDFTISVHQEIPFDELLQSFKQGAPAELVHIRLLAIFADADLKAALKHNVTLRFTYQSPTTSLSSDYVDGLQKKLEEKAVQCLKNMHT